MTHVRRSIFPSARGPVLPALKEFLPAHFFDYDRFFHAHLAHNLPAANVKENDKSLEIELMVPGFNKDDFDISFTDGLLTISAEGKHEAEKEGSYSQREFVFSAFSRSFDIPANTSEEDIQAKYADGVLRLTIAKKIIDPVKPKKSVKVN